MDEFLKQFDHCLQHEVSFCQSACPFNLDVSTFISRLQEGRFNAAYKTYRDATGFPFVVNRICSENCRGACLRNAVIREDDAGTYGGEPIELRKLEAACLEHATRKEPTRYNVPSKGKSVAIVGAGISGMACALRLATKKYNVTIYERSDHIGGSILDMIEPEIVTKDFELQMQHLSYKLKLGYEVNSLEEIIQAGYEDNKEDAAKSAVAAVMRTATTHAKAKTSGTYDAIYVATGKGGNDFGRPEMIGDTAVFIGGSIDREDITLAIADGLDIATAIDNYTLTKIHKYPEPQETKIAIDETQYIDTKAKEPAAGTPSEAIYSKDEAIAEAGRCLKCQCSSCQLHCDLIEYVHKWPLRLRDEIVATTAPGKSELHATPAVRLINSCTHCGLCKETCPEDIDIDGLIQSARFRMHKLKKMPWAFNDFFLRDMEFTNSDAAYICRAPEGKEGACKFVFFPGCQLGASAPEIVRRSYGLLLDIEPATGIMLGCCGIPADWAGDEELHDEITDRIRADWERLGKPVMILACPTCRNTLERCLPEIKTRFLYDVIAEEDCARRENIEDQAFAVFDPCATDMDDEVRRSVRKICTDLNLQLEALPVQEKWTACCSYGGHGALADPGFTKFVRDKRIGESELPYITYCINCRDAFLHEGKSAVHILDLLFGTEPKLDTVTQRRENRILLKRQLLKEFWDESPIDDGSDAKAAGLTEDGMRVKLIMSDDVRHKLSEEYILEQEAADVVGFCERTGRTLYDTEADTYSGYRKIGNLTYWVTYRPAEDSDPQDSDLRDEDVRTYELLNAYSHRMEIELEMIWNGEKIDIDM